MLLQLLLNADMDGYVEYSEARIVSASGLTRQQVRTVIKNLLSEKVIEKVKPNQLSNQSPNQNENVVKCCEIECCAVFNLRPNQSPNQSNNQSREQEKEKEIESSLPQTPTLEDKEKDKEKESEKEVDKSTKKVPTTELEKQFEEFRVKYREFGGSVRGFSTEFEALKKKHKDWKEVIPMLLYSLEKENRERVEAQMMGKFFPRMQKCQTYLNQRSWEAYSDGYEDYDPNEYHPEGFMYDAEFDAYRFCDYIPNVDLRDGYKDEDRPDGARIVEQLNVWVWNKEQQKWNRA